MIRRPRSPRQTAALPGAPRPGRAAVRPGFSLLDVVVGLVVAAVVAAAIGGVLILVSRAVPQTASATTPHTVSSGRFADDIVTELRYAVNVTELNPHAITFLVPDRNADGREEVIRFAWSGVAGAPVTREYNSGTPVEVVGAADKLDFAYAREAESADTTTTTLVTSNEVLLSSFTGWTGITASAMQLTVSPTTWMSQAFKIPSGIVPASAKNIAITTVKLRLKKPTSGGGPVSIAIHRRQGTGSHLADAAPVGTARTVDALSLTTSFAMVPVTFNDVVFPTLESDLVIVVKGAVATAGIMSYLNAAAAPVDNNYLRWTTDSAATWQPTSGFDRNDAQYEVWGTWQTEQTTNTVGSVYFLTAVDVSLAATQDPGGTVTATARILNRPRVSAP